MLLAAPASLTACNASRPSNATMSALAPLGGSGVIAVKNGTRVLEEVGGFASGLDASENVAKRIFTADTPFRAASISKTVVLLTARAMAKAGVLDLSLDISGPMGMRLRHPRYPDVAVTLQNLLSHRSGITDPEIYWTLPDGDIRDLLSADMFKGGKPGDWFEYANINYGIAATILEAVSGTRFDLLTQHYVLGPLGLDAGFNWAGVSQAKRRSGATLYRLVDGAMTVQTDGPEMLGGTAPIFYGDNPDFDIETYEAGRNGTLLSPQGGLRASLNDLLVLAKALGEDPDLQRVDWLYDGQNGAGEDGHFVSFGPGLYVYPPELSPIPGQLMIGHHGSAYGLFGGIWHLPQINAQIVHAVTATPEPPAPYHSGPPAIAAETRIFLDKAMAALELT